MARADDHVRIRLDDGSGLTPFRLKDSLHRRLKDAADANRRSMNAEIVDRLEASFSSPAALNDEISALIQKHIDAEVQRRLREIAAQIGGA